MKTLLVMLVAPLVLAGCFVRTGPPRHSARRSCPPAYHWEGDDCVHNGRGHDHHDHDHDHHDHGHGH
jgi:hypothetical protein